MTLSAKAIYADGSEGDVIYDSYSCIDANGNSYDLEDGIFKTYDVGDYEIKVNLGDIESNLITITAVEEDLNSAQASGIEVFHNNGQSFITWNEISQIMPSNDITYEEYFNTLDSYTRDIKYNIYRSESPIESLDGVELIKTVDSLTI